MVEEQTKNEKIEAKVEAKVEKVEAKVEVAVKKVIAEETKKESGEIKKEVNKRLRDRFFEKTKKEANNFGGEFRNQTITAITAAFAFLIALSWRDPISEGVNSLILRLGLKENAVYYKFLSAFLITFLGVIFLVILTRWKSDKSKKS